MIRTAATVLCPTCGEDPDRIDAAGKGRQVSTEIKPWSYRIDRGISNCMYRIARLAENGGHLKTTDLEPEDMMPSVAFVAPFVRSQTTDRLTESRSVSGTVWRASSRP